MVEPVTALAVKGATDVSEVAKRGADTFLTAVLREPGEALGELFADKIRERRHANLIKIAARAEERLHKAGVSPMSVPLSIIHPALEAASLEEDLELQEIWANLLANAADPRAYHTVPASFPAVLKQLSPREIKFLDALFEWVLEKTRGRKARYGWASAVEFQHRDAHYVFAKSGLARFVWLEGMTPLETEKRRNEIEADRHEVEFCIDNLRRHEIITESIDMDKQERYIEGSSQGITYRFPKDEFRLTYTYCFSHFGVAFVNTCRPPRVDSKE